MAVVCGVARGKYRSKVVPCPTWLQTSMPPPQVVTIPKTVDRPRPVPLCASLVVKKGSNRWPSTSVFMPHPVSVTVNFT